MLGVYVRDEIKLMNKTAEVEELAVFCSIAVHASRSDDMQLLCEFLEPRLALRDKQ